MQVLEQHSGAGSSDRQKAGMVGERLRLVPQRMANDPGSGSRASDPQGTSEEGRQARLTRPSKIHFHPIWRDNLSHTIAFRTSTRRNSADHTFSQRNPSRSSANSCN